MKNSLLIGVLCISFLACNTPKKEKNIAINTVQKTYSIEKIVDELSNPWGMTWLPDGSMLITEKSGELIQFKDGTKTEIKNVPEVYNRGQGGLLDIKVHPDYATNGWIYFTYASTEGEGEGGNTKLSRAKLKENALSEIEHLYKASPNSTRGQHFGSRIEFDDKGYVYFSIGERGDRDTNPQDKTRDGGKIYRLHDDGRVPEDNPFFNEADAVKAIYTFGNRNPQGMDQHPETGEIWIHEHGPKGGDEVNILKSGANYGWPLISYGVNYSGTKFTDKTKMEGMEDPIYYWVPSIAPCGMTFVTGDKYPDWKGNLLVGSLKFNYVELLKLEGNKVVDREKIAEDIGRVRNVQQGPDGYIYIAVEGDGIFRIMPGK